MATYFGGESIISVENIEFSESASSGFGSNLVSLASNEWARVWIYQGTNITSDNNANLIITRPNSNLTAIQFRGSLRGTSSLEDLNFMNPLVIGPSRRLRIDRTSGAGSVTLILRGLIIKYRA